MTSAHDDAAAISPWVVRAASLIAAGGRVLDLAAGEGRHARWFAARGHPVLAVDRDTGAMQRLAAVPGIEARVVDLEAGSWPLAGERFAGIVVTCYLHRPLLPRLAEALEPGGVLVYETFMVGNEVFGRPANPDFLLSRNELLETFGGTLEVIAFRQGYVDRPRQAMMQAIIARRA